MRRCTLGRSRLFCCKCIFSEYPGFARTAGQSASHRIVVRIDETKSADGKAKASFTQDRA